MKLKHGILWICLAWLAVAPARAQAVRAVTETTPYTFVAEGKVVGTATEVVELTLQRARLTPYTVHLYPWARAYDMALKEPNVLIFLIARTAEREEQFHWAGEIMKIQYHLFRLQGRGQGVSDLASARSRTIGVMRDDVRHQYLRAKGFEKLVVSAHPIDNFRKLLSGQVEMVPLTADDATMLCRETGFDCAGLERVLTLDEAATGLYMAYGRQTPMDVVERTRQAFGQLRAEGVVRRTMARAP